MNASCEVVCASSRSFVEYLDLVCFVHPESNAPKAEQSGLSQLSSTLCCSVFTHFNATLSFHCCVFNWIFKWIIIIYRIKWYAISLVWHKSFWMLASVHGCSTLRLKTMTWKHFTCCTCTWAWKMICGYQSDMPEMKRMFRITYEKWDKICVANELWHWYWLLTL